MEYEIAMAYAKEHGFNAINRLDIKERVVYSLYIEKNGIEQPFGLPVLIEITNGHPTRLSQKDCDFVFSLLQE